jgi:hypothetical protein
MVWALEKKKKKKKKEEEAEKKEHLQTCLQKAHASSWTVKNCT